MKLQLFAQVLTVSVLALGTIATISQPSYAQRATYFCARSNNGVPTTYALNLTGERKRLISWTKNWSNKLSSEARCREVSARFQRLNAKGRANAS